MFRSKQNLYSMLNLKFKLNLKRIKFKVYYQGYGKAPLKSTDGGLNYFPFKDQILIGNLPCINRNCKF